MKDKLLLILVSAAIALGVSCAPSPSAPTPKIDTPTIVAPTTKPAPAETATVTRTVPTAPSPRTLVPIVSPTLPQGGKDMNGTPAPSELETDPIVLQAKQDLAKRLAINIDQISLVEAQAVTWPDGSLGCPQPGMMYTQALVDGYLIRLRAGGQIYEYHNGGNRPPFLCQSKP